MGQSSELGDIYDFNESEESKREFINEFAKAVDALTIGESNRLKEKLVEEDAVISENNNIIKSLMNDIQNRLQKGGL